MRCATWVRTTVVLAMLSLLILLPTAAWAQDGSPEDADDFDPGVTIEGDPAQYPDPEPDDEGEVQPAGADLVLAQPPYTMNYQGYLTDSSGVPVDAIYDMVARLYDAEAGGTAEWGPETHNDVPVVAGLFNLVLGSTVVLNPDVFDEALFLELTVDGTVLPRQPLRTTAYAFGLVPGAEVEGAPPAGTTYALSVANETGVATGRGFFASGPQYGIYARETGSGDIGIYTPDYVRALGYRSGADSYVFVPGHEIIPPDGFNESTVKLDAETGGRLAIRTAAAGVNKSVYLPIQVPSVLFGQNVTIEQIQLYYELSDPNNSYITQVFLEQRDLADGTINILLNSATDLKGTGVRSAAFTPTDATLSSSTGPLTFRILSNFQDTTDAVRIYGIRLRLGHQ